MFSKRSVHCYHGSGILSVGSVRNVAGDATVNVFQNAEQAVSDNLHLSLKITLQSGMKSTDGPLKLSISNLSSSLSFVLLGERLCERHCSSVPWVTTNICSLYVFNHLFLSFSFFPFASQMDAHFTLGLF